MTRPVRIEPRMKLEAALVSFLDRECQRIVVGFRSSAHLSGQILRPWLELRWIECIVRRTHLKHDRVHVHRNCLVQNRKQLGLLFPGAESGLRGPVDIRYGCDPDCTKFTRNSRGLRLLASSCGGDKKDKRRDGGQRLHWDREMGYFSGSESRKLSLDARRGGGQTFLSRKLPNSKERSG